MRAPVFCPRPAKGEQRNSSRYRETRLAMHSSSDREQSTTRRVRTRDELGGKMRGTADGLFTGIMFTGIMAGITTRDCRLSPTISLEISIFPNGSRDATPPPFG
jgi:hypothetical protein